MTTSSVYAGFWLRLLTLFIDYLLISFLTNIALFLIAPNVLNTIWPLLFVELLIAMLVILPSWIFMGASPGKRLFGLSIVDKNTGEPASPVQCMKRFLAGIFSFLLAGGGFFAIGFDRKKQGWHDKFANTLVVEAGLSKKIFINYRQKVSLMHAGRLRDNLVTHFGAAAIFHDKSSLTGGSNWKVDIDKSINSCSVLIAVIGRGWLDQLNPDGSRRIDDPDDYVAMEIATAMKRGVQVVPVLVDNAKRIHSSDLPERLVSFADIEPVVIEDKDWNSDINKLIHAIYRYTEDPRKLGWRNISAIVLCLISVTYLGDDVVAQEDANISCVVGIIALVASLASYARFRHAASFARSWSIGLCALSTMLIIMAISEMPQ